MQQSGFSHDNDFGRRGFLAKGDHFFSGTNFIGQHADGIGAFRMRNNRRIRIFLADSVDAAGGELNVHVTGTSP